MTPPLSDFLQFAIETTFEAGRLTLAYFQTGIEPEFKEDNSPVTVADRRAEEHIRHRIESQFPGHNIVGEEFGADIGRSSEFCWFIDPIDGTKAFVRGVPLYGVLIGLEIAGRIEVGVANFPALNEMVYAAAGHGCHWNGRSCRVIETKTLKQGVVAYTDAASFGRHGRQKAWRRVTESAYYSVGWSDAYGHALVATGRLELMLDPFMNSYDCGPFPVILREAGGFFGDWTGNETIYANEAISTTRTLLPEVLRLLN